ncbi:MAG TPA: single-stranded DNA-binding protein [Candidatus Dormibacteraeota bacterium]|jgi:single-strand DNA-binding protein
MLNRAEVIGRLTRDPELRYTPKGTPVCHLALATNEMVGSGEHREERTEFHDVTAWDTLAETCAQYLAKGRLIFVEGRLHTERWERDAVPQRRTVIVAGTVRFLDRPEGTPIPADTADAVTSDAER